MLNKRADKLELLRIAEAVALEKSIDKELIINSMETGIAKAAKSKFGNENEIRNVLDKYPSLNKKLDIIHTENFVPMDAKPADAIRRIGKDSSMWLSIDSCAKKESDVVLSAGNTGALMALSKLILKKTDSLQLLILML